jgi:uncharacterized membrane protein
VGFLEFCIWLLLFSYFPFLCYFVSERSVDLKAFIVVFLLVSIVIGRIDDECEMGIILDNMLRAKKLKTQIDQNFSSRLTQVFFLASESKKSFFPCIFYVGICDHFFFFVMTGKFCMYSSGQ